MKTIDLFCGCGGMSLGFMNAGFELMAAFDHWQPALESYRHNFTHPIFECDLSQEETKWFIFTHFKPQLIIGGPPCQDFSSAGKRDESLGRADLTMVIVELPPAGHLWLSATASATILHLFEASCYLLNPAGAILALVSPAIGLGPFQAVLATPFDFRRLDPQAKIWLEPTRLIIDPVAFDFSRARVGVARPAWGQLSRPGLRAALPTLHNLLAQTSPPATFLAPAIIRLPQTGRLLAAIQAHDRATCEAVVPQVAGLGPGLTPAGDDFLMGVLYGLWATQPGSPLIATIAEAAMPHTTRLSAAWLAAAGRGEATQAWHTFVQALAAGHLTAMGSAAEKILNIGHSSGREALTGFVSLLSVS